jgi:hippurate hydrolase
VEEENIKPCAKTGFVVDIKGKGPEAALGDQVIKTIALRSDIDALPMPENNFDLPYRTTTKFAHMCGHDGHICMLLSGASVICANRDQIPSN